MVPMLLWNNLVWRYFLSVYGGEMANSAEKEEDQERWSEMRKTEMTKRRERAYRVTLAAE